MDVQALSLTIAFADFTVDLKAGELRKHGLKIKLQEQPFQILVMLLQRPGDVVTREEVPHAIAVLVDNFEEKKDLIKIRATLYVEREGQKGILIGKGGETIKKIGTNARKEIEAILGAHVFLELSVHVQPNWRQNSALVRQLDWHRQLEQLASE